MFLNSILQLIASALDALVHGDDFCSVDGNMNLIHRIASLHVIHQLNKSQVLWFGQLVMHFPGIMLHLREDANICDETEMVCYFENDMSMTSDALLVYSRQTNVFSGSSSICCA